eukprot:gene27385-biopygen3230
MVLRPRPAALRDIPGVGKKGGVNGVPQISIGHASGDLASRDNSRGGTTRSESVSSLESVATGHDVPGWGQPTGLGLTGSSLVQTSLGSRAALLTPREGLSQVPSPNSDGELAPEPVTPVTGSYDGTSASDSDSDSPFVQGHAPAGFRPRPGLRSSKLEGKDDSLVLGLSAALASDEEAAPYAAFISSTTDLTYETATAADNPDRDAWIIACKDEMASIAAHGTWILTPASRVKRKILPNMWIFTIKNGLDGQPERHKARVVIKGFHQRPGLEFDAVLVKSLYGLKQAPRMWCREVRKVLVTGGYAPCWLGGEGAYLCATYNLFLSLDMQLTLDAEGRTTQIILSQHNAITALVERFNQCKAHEGNATIPMLAGAWTGDAVNSALLPNNKLYISLVGSLIYLSTCTRPDIAYAVSCLSRFSAVPTRAHWKAAKRLLLYLKLHKDWGLCYSHTPVFDLTVFSDASFGEDKLTRRSQTGISILVGGTLVHWISKRQVTPAVSTAESEYKALSNAAREVQWIKQLRNDLGLPCTLVTIQCDSQGALSWTGDWKLEPKAKHIDIIHHYIKCLVEDKRLAVTYVNTKDNKADPFTKPLTPALFWEFMKLHGMVSLATAQAKASS